MATTTTTCNKQLVAVAEGIVLVQEMCVWSFQTSAAGQWYHGDGQPHCNGRSEWPALFAELSLATAPAPRSNTAAASHILNADNSSSNPKLLPCWCSYHHNHLFCPPPLIMMLGGPTFSSIDSLGSKYDNNNWVPPCWATSTLDNDSNNNSMHSDTTNEQQWT